MVSRSVRLIAGLVVLITFSVNVHGKSLTSGDQSPYQYFLQNPSEASRFMEQIKADPELSAQQVEAYSALVNDDASGDIALEQISTEELAWFYGWEMQQEPNGEAQVWDASTITTELNDSHYRDCLDRELCVMVSKSSQRLYVFRRGQQIMVNDAGNGQENWQAWARVSTARPGKWTPNGYFTIDELAHAGRTSYRYPGAGLFYAMQLNGNIFIHGTNVSNYPALGSPASAGCVRTRWEVSENLNLSMREIGGRVNGVLANKQMVRAIVAPSIPDQYLQAY